MWLLNRRAYCMNEKGGYALKRRPLQLQRGPSAPPLSAEIKPSFLPAKCYRSSLTVEWEVR